MMIESSQKTNNNFLTNSDKLILSELAEGIANYYFYNGAVNPEVIASENNISYSYGNYKDSFDGMIECFNKDFHIYINIDRLEHAYTERARFTFAHELGHFFIDEQRNALLLGLSPSHSCFTDFSSKNYAERQADYFASCLLLPQNKIETDCLKRKFSFQLISELSKKYQVSLTATAIRFTIIGNYPIMVVYSVGGKISWYCYSKDFPYWSLRHGKIKIPENTVAGDYFYNQVTSKSTQEVFASDWFDNVFESHTRRKFNEHCVFGTKSILSIIWEG
ncbi:MAG: ImmA/IrrE family metallo-endopeptidase [Bacteroidales bacterium]|nr:ImmA/IrrE family metallo-endopeptidase [Bacteroidales bacterium]